MRNPFRRRWIVRAVTTDTHRPVGSIYDRYWRELNALDRAATLNGARGRDSLIRFSVRED